MIVAQHGAAVVAARPASISSSKLMKMFMWSLSSLAARPTASAGSTAPLVHTSRPQLVVVGDLPQAGSFNDIVDAAHRRVDRIHRDETNAQIGIKILVGRDIAAASLEAHLHVQLAAFRECGDIDVLVQDLHVAVGLDHSRGHDSGLVGAQIQRLGAFAVRA